MTAEDVARLREYLGYDKPKKAKGGKVKRTVHHLDGEEVHIVERKR